MQIKDFLAEEDTAIDVNASDKGGLLQTLSAQAASILKLPPQVVASAIQKRDELGSTGIGGGVSIPHARFREVTKPYGFFARLRHPIEFQAIDDEPVDLVFLLLLPASSQLDQLNALAAVARKLRAPKTLTRLRDATSAAELYRAIAD
jgi:PTS system nitrogen regulatory IIA component